MRAVCRRRGAPRPWKKKNVGAAAYRPLRENGGGRLCTGTGNWRPQFGARFPVRHKPLKECDLLARFQCRLPPRTGNCFPTPHPSELVVSAGLACRPGQQGCRLAGLPKPPDARPYRVRTCQRTHLRFRGLFHRREQRCLPRLATLSSDHPLA